MVINGENESIKEIPYGISDYELIRTENYYYVDKTPYLKNLKKTGRYLFFTRPRRFGKSLFISLSNLYIIHSEKELNKGYADLVLVPFLARYPGIKYSYLMEIKYLKSGAKRGDPDVQELINKAEEQLKTYSIDEKSRKDIEKTRLINRY